MKIYEDPDFAHLPCEVERLFELSGHESFFNLPGWYRLVAECGLDCGSRVSLAVDDHAHFALACRRVPHERTLFSCTNPYTCEHDVLGNRANAEPVRAFAKELASSVRPLNSIRLDGLDPTGSRFTALIEGFRAAGFIAKPYFCWGVWFEPTRGVDFDHYLAGRPSVLRNTWKRKYATLKKSATPIYRTYRRDDELGPLIAAYESVRERSWKHAEPFPEFIPRLIRLAAAQGALRLGILNIDNEPAAAQFWIVWEGRATIYKLVYAEKFSNFSPGTLLTMHMLRTVLGEDRPSEINFGRGDDAYKKQWFSSRRERWGIEAANPRTWRGLALAARLRAGLARDYVKASLGYAKPRANMGGNTGP